MIIVIIVIYNNINNISENKDLSLLTPNTVIDGSISVKIPILKAIISDEEKAIKFVFPNLINSSNINGDETIFSCGKSAILCATNEYVDEWNERIQDLIINEPINLSLQMFLTMLMILIVF